MASYILSMSLFQTASLKIIKYVQLIVVEFSSRLSVITMYGLC